MTPREALVEVMEGPFMNVPFDCLDAMIFEDLLRQRGFTIEPIEGSDDHS